MEDAIREIIERNRAKTPEELSCQKKTGRIHNLKDRLAHDHRVQRQPDDQ
jgi:hypothetical protein